MCSYECICIGVIYRYFIDRKKPGKNSANSEYSFRSNEAHAPFKQIEKPTNFYSKCFAVSSTFLYILFVGKKAYTHRKPITSRPKCTTFVVFPTEIDNYYLIFSVFLFFLAVRQRYFFFGVFFVFISVYLYVSAYLSIQHSIVWTACTHTSTCTARQQ